MLLNLTRSPSAKGCTFGELKIGSSPITLYTLERPEVQIPVGVYGLELRHSPRFNRLLPHLLEVPGRSDILIHTGNWPRDTEGCILVGKSHSDTMLLSSGLALDLLIHQIQEHHDRGDAVSIRVVGPSCSSEK